MLILKIVFILLSILFSILMLILFVPLNYRIKGVSLDEKIISLNVLCFFGLLGFSGSYRLNQGLESKINILGIKIKLDKEEKTSKEKEKKKKKKDNKNNKKRSFSVTAIKRVLGDTKKLLLYIMPDRIEGYGRLGFYDPYYTGITCSIVEALRGMGFHNINLKYVFEDEIYEGEVYIEGSILIAYIVYIAIGLLLNKATRKMILN